MECVAECLGWRNVFLQIISKCRFDSLFLNEIVENACVFYEKLLKMKMAECLKWIGMAECYF